MGVRYRVHRLLQEKDANSPRFSYGLIDTLNKLFQEELNITRAESSGLQAAYFGCV